jgi:TPR repeat protein
MISSNDQKIQQDHSSNLLSKNSSINSINNSLHGELSQVIQNFNIMNSMAINEFLFENDLNIVIDELVDSIFKKLNEGKESVIKQHIIDYISNHNIQEKEIYDYLLINQNSSNSIFLLGCFYHHGIETDIDKLKAFELYQNAAELGNSNGIYVLGYCYENGIGTNIDKFKAFEFYKKAAELENSNGINKLGYCYHHGIGTNIDKLKAFELYQKAADLGNLNGINMLGYCYENGIGTSINKQMATELYQKAKNLKNDKDDSEDSKITTTIVSGLVDLFIKITNEGKARDQRRSIIDDYLSLHNVTIERIYRWLNNNHKTDPNYGYFLGYLNFSGIGTSINIDKAFIYFYKASLDHHAISQYYLGVCYEFGFGTKINEKLAFECYERSAKQNGSVVGKFALGICYEKGIGTVKSESIALYWFQKAADNGHVIAQYYVGNFYQFGICVNIDYNEAFHYYNLSANNECSYSINMLGYCYLKGIGTTIDKTKAFELYLKAANMGNKIAQCNVAICYEDGVGTKKDSEKAMEWYKKLDNEYDEYDESEGKEIGKFICLSFMNFKNISKR